MTASAYPRIVIKDDRDSGIGRGCILCVEQLEDQRVVRILTVAARTAPQLIDNEMLASEGWRDTRDGRDLHEDFRAFDISLNQINGDRMFRERAGIAWAARIRAKLGDDYDVIVHGSGRNLHLHIEFDPK